MVLDGKKGRIVRQGLSMIKQQRTTSNREIEKPSKDITRKGGPDSREQSRSPHLVVGRETRETP